MPAKAPTPEPQLPEQLRELIRASKLTAYALGGLAQVDEAQVKRFMLGERDLRLETAGRIAAALGARLVVGKGRRPTG